MGPLITGISILQIDVISSVSRRMTVDIPVEVEGKANEVKNVKRIR